MTNASTAVTNAYNQGVRDGIRRLADSIKGNPTGDVSSLLQDAAHDAVSSPQRTAEALSTGPAAVRDLTALQDAVRLLYEAIVALDPEPGPVEEYFPDGTPSAVIAEALVAVGEANWQYVGLAGSEVPVPEVSPEIEASLRAQEEAER